MADGFARYVPEKDLPEEIRKLPTSETRCHYCGVSYLVHHEVKKLESLVEELQSKLQSSYERNEELIKVYNAVFNRANKVEEEKEAAEQMLQYKEAFLQSSLSLLRSIQPTVHQWIVTLKSQLHLTVNQMNDDVLKLAKYFKLVIDGLLKENADLRKSLEASHSELEVHIKEKVEIVKCLEDKDSFIEVLKQNKLDMINLCEEIEKKYSGVCQELKSTNQAHLELVKQLKVIKEDREDIGSQLKKQLLENSLIAEDLVKLQNRLQVVSNDNEATKEKFIKEKSVIVEFRQQEILKKDEELSSMKMKIEKERKDLQHKLVHLDEQLVKARNDLSFQASQNDIKIAKMKEITLSEQKESMMKLRLTWESEMAKTLNAQQHQHVQELNQCKVYYESKIEQLKASSKLLEESHVRKIKELQNSLEREKTIFDAEVTKHIIEEKELRLTIDRYKQELNEKQRLTEQMTQKLMNNESELENKMQHLHALSKEEKENWESKLNEAYTEITSLQSIIEKQVHERKQLIDQYTKT